MGLTGDHAHFAAVVVAPTYNNAGTLDGILDRIEEQGLPLLVVDDGSTDGTASLLARREAAAEPGRLQILTHPQNRGKADALRTAFAAAIAAGCTHAVTIDTDGQLEPEQIPELLAVARRCPEALIVGVRDARASDYPASRRLGRFLSNLMIRIESGCRVEDSQCGFRVYPLGLMQTVRCRSQRYGYETEILARAGWAGCEVIGTPVRCRYLPRGEGVSHMRPVPETMRGILMHARLLVRSLIPWPAQPCWPPGSAQHTGPVWRRLLRWLSPVPAWRRLRETGVGRARLSAAVAVGVFIANLPAYGLQTLLGLAAARQLRLQPLAVVLGSHVSTPPIGPVMIAAAVAVGHLLRHGRLPEVGPIPADFRGILDAAGPLLVDWMIGFPVVGLVMAAAAFAMTSLGLRLVQGQAPGAGEAGEAGPAEVSSLERT